MRLTADTRERVAQARELDRIAIPLINSGMAVDEAYREAADQIENAGEVREEAG